MDATTTLLATPRPATSQSAPQSEGNSTGPPDGFVMAALFSDLERDGSRAVEVAEHTVALFLHNGEVFAVDNRCPHMGFPLQKGSVKDGILTCHWHHARFDLACGGTFDPWADNVRSYPVEVRGSGDSRTIWVEPTPASIDPVRELQERLEHGMRHNIPLIIGKAVVGLENAGADPRAALAVGARFGTLHAANGWGAGLTILTAMGNILPYLRPADRSLALYNGLSQVAAECAGRPPRYPIDALPTASADPAAIKRWFREFIEERHSDGAERCLRTAVDTGMPREIIANMIFAACTDHLYRDVGHTLDFCNKAFEMLDLIGWEDAGVVLTSLVPGLRQSSRQEESSSWRHPIDLAGMLWSEFEKLPDALKAGVAAAPWSEPESLVETLLADDPAASISALTGALRSGAAPAQIARTVTYAAARRIAQFHTRNEFGDWNTVLHTFTYANAVHQAMRRSPSVELLRGVYDAAISIYLDRFLNRPPAPLPKPGGTVPQLPADLLEVMNTQSQVQAAGSIISDAALNGQTDEAVAAIGAALLREDSGFHTFQVVEAAFRLFHQLDDPERARHVLTAAARYVAAHAPTTRAGGQTFSIAQRLQRGESIVEA